MGKKRPEALDAANHAKLKVSASMENLVAQKKSHLALFIRIIGIKLADTKIMLAISPTIFSACSSANPGLPKGAASGTTDRIPKQHSRQQY
jgi:hypothetical protein